MVKFLIGVAVVILLIVIAALFLGTQISSSLENAAVEVGTESASPGDNDTEELNTDDDGNRR